MSKFNHYATELRALAMNSFAEFDKVKKAYEAAKEKRDNTKPRMGADAISNAKAARAEAEYKEAEAIYREAKRKFGESERATLAQMRKKLAQAVDDEFSADPAALDANTLELLKSGILRPSEYGRFLNDAKNKGNHTMARLIGQYALDAAAKEAEKNGEYSEVANDLRVIGYQGKQTGAHEILKGFDVLTDIYNRCTRNPAMISQFDELAAPIIENM